MIIKFKIFTSRVIVGVGGIYLVVVVPPLTVVVGCDSCCGTVLDVDIVVVEGIEDEEDEEDEEEEVEVVDDEEPSSVDPPVADEEDPYV